MKKKTKPGPATKPKHLRRVLLQVRVAPVTLALFKTHARAHKNLGRALDAIATRLPLP